MSEAATEKPRVKIATFYLDNDDPVEDGTDTHETTFNAVIFSLKNLTDKSGQPIGYTSLATLASVKVNEKSIISTYDLPDGSFIRAQKIVLTTHPKQRFDPSWDLLASTLGKKMLDSVWQRADDIVTKPGTMHRDDMENAQWFSYRSIVEGAKDDLTKERLGLDGKVQKVKWQYVYLESEGERGRPFMLDESYGGDDEADAVEESE